MRNARRYWLTIWLIASLLCVIICPFGTDQLSLTSRVIYWSCWNGFSAILMFSLLEIARKLGFQNYITTSIACSFIFALIYTTAMSAIHSQFLPYQISAPPIIFLNCFLIAIAIFTLVYLAIRQNNSKTSTPALQARLGKYPNAQILALCAQDHYVQIITNQGNELLRMNFSDAIEEMKGVAGLQVHRSYWVSKKSILKIDRKTQNIELVNGSKIPISRRRLSTIKTTLQNAHQTS